MLASLILFSTSHNLQNFFTTHKHSTKELFLTSSAFANYQRKMPYLEHSKHSSSNSPKKKAEQKIKGKTKKE